MCKTLTSLAIWGGLVGGGGSFNNQNGPSWFTSILSFILIYMSNIEATYDMIKNLLISKINTFLFLYFFFRGHVTRGIRGTEMSPKSQWRHMYNKGK